MVSSSGSKNRLSWVFAADASTCRGRPFRNGLFTVSDAQLELEAVERAKVRGDISTMVSERPDEVAAMLRGWLSENKA